MCARYFPWRSLQGRAVPPRWPCHRRAGIGPWPYRKRGTIRTCDNGCCTVACTGDPSLEKALAIVLTGVGATAFIDAWTLLRTRLLRVPATDFSLVGRWIGHMPRGQFIQRPVGAAAPVPGEGVIGWVAHYLIGVAF